MTTLPTVAAPRAAVRVRPVVTVPDGFVPGPDGHRIPVPAPRTPADHTARTSTDGTGPARPGRHRLAPPLVTRVPVTPGPATSAPIALTPVTPAPVGQAPVGQAPVGQAQVSQAPVGQAPVGQAPVGQAPVGQAASPAPVDRAPVPRALAANRVWSVAGRVGNLVVLVAMLVPAVAVGGLTDGTPPTGDAAVVATTTLH